MTKIIVLLNGPYRVDSADATVVDWNGATYPITKRPFYLCRCGASTNKPFCDGTHSKMGFKAAEAAVPGSTDNPAKKTRNPPDTVALPDAAQKWLRALGIRLHGQRAL